MALPRPEFVQICSQLIGDFERIIPEEMNAGQPLTEFGLRYDEFKHSFKKTIDRMIGIIQKFFKINQFPNIWITRALARGQKT